MASHANLACLRQRLLPDCSKYIWIPDETAVLKVLLLEQEITQLIPPILLGAPCVNYFVLSLFLSLIISFNLIILSLERQWVCF